MGARKMAGVGSPEQKAQLQSFISDDLAELKLVLRNHQRRKDDDKGASMRSFYREKYKGRYMQPSYTGGYNYSMTPPASASSSVADGMTAQSPSNARRAQNGSPVSPSAWSAVQARSPGPGSSYTYQYGRDQHQA